MQKNIDIRSILETIKKSKTEHESRIRKPPATLNVADDTVTIFLGGSIEMNKAEKWQEAVTEKLLKNYKNIVIYNPRRDDWDSSCKQEISDKNFYGQVDWEHSAIMACDIFFLYFQPDTKSPISLLELGLMASKAPEKTIVCCPDGFWRKGNVDYICKKYNIKQIEKLDTLIDVIKTTKGLR